jgi:hypothetical protein
LQTKEKFVKRAMKVVALLVVGVGAMWGSSLDIYNDTVIYRFVPTGRYLGFISPYSKAVCGASTIDLIPSDECPKSDKLCRKMEKIEELDSRISGVESSIGYLDKLIDRSRLSQAGSQKWIELALKGGEKRAELMREKRELARKRDIEKRLFSAGTSSKRPYALARECHGELELRLPPASISVRLENEIDITDRKKLKISKYLLLENDSGIDFSVSDANIRAQNSHIGLEPIRFVPKVVRPVEPPKRGRMVKKLSKLSTPELIADAPSPSVSVESLRRVGYRSFTIGKLDLPSDGERVRVKIGDEEVTAYCRDICFSYRWPATVYEACTFRPASTVDEHEWIVKENGKILSDRARGLYEKGHYLLYVDIDDEVVVKRKKAIDKSRSVGIFGSDIRRRDGFSIEVLNTSSKGRRVELVERIPRSASDRIEVRIVDISGADRDSLSKDGRLTLTLELKPHEKRDIEVSYELEYDKNIKITY